MFEGKRRIFKKNDIQRQAHNGIRPSYIMFLLCYHTVTVYGIITMI